MNSIKKVRLVLNEELRTMNGFLLPPFPELSSIEIINGFTIFAKQYVVVADDSEVHDSTFATAGMLSDFFSGKLAA